MVRYSFSFKNSICQYLERDFRFIKHYYDLLIKKFPERQQKLRFEIYEQYKEGMIRRESFDKVFLEVDRAMISKHKYHLRSLSRSKGNNII